MNTDLQQVLVEKYPKIFHVRKGTETMPFAMFGIECDDGWFNIINTLCYQIQSYLDWQEKTTQRIIEKDLADGHTTLTEHIPQVVVTQIKEKYGTLRFYYDGGDEHINGMVTMAEAISAVTCETCGNQGKLRGQHWFYTACEAHARDM